MFWNAFKQNHKQISEYIQSVRRFSQETGFIKENIGNNDETSLTAKQVEKKILKQKGIMIKDSQSCIAKWALFENLKKISSSNYWKVHTLDEYLRIK
jgi:hypothetical protein